MTVNPKRRKWMFVVAIECPYCISPVWSRHRHDMRYCFCGYCFIDGGRDYTRIGYGTEDTPQPWTRPITRRIRVPHVDPPRFRWPY